jgi:hypothetical protein
MTDVLRHPAYLFRILRGRPATDPEEDLRILRDGSRPLIVSALRYEQGHWRVGTLRLDMSAAEPIVWRWWVRSNRAVPIPAPIDVEGVSAVSGRDRIHVKEYLFRILTVYAGGRSWRLAIPTIDLTLVRAAIMHVNQAV